MNPQNLELNLKGLTNNEYPGRLIIIGKNENGHIVILYTIMGRSKSSQNRIFESYGKALIRTIPINAAEIEKPELTIYNALNEIKIAGRTNFIVTNGSQTDDIMKNLEKEEFEQILSKLKHEPDGPIYTSRISGIVYVGKEMQRFSLSRIKADLSDLENSSKHECYKGLPVTPGMGFCIHTYAGNGEPPLRFEGEPFALPLIGNADQIAEQYWSILNPKFKVALFVKVINPVTLESDLKIINQGEKIK